MTNEPNAQAEKIFREILDLLEELATAFTDARDNEEDLQEDETIDVDPVDLIVEEAAERGLDEEQVERVFKSIMSLARKASED